VSTTIVRHYGQCWWNKKTFGSQRVLMP
jgi:hypothetical protein